MAAKDFLKTDVRRGRLALTLTHAQFGKPGQIDRADTHHYRGIDIPGTPRLGKMEDMGNLLPALSLNPRLDVQSHLNCAGDRIQAEPAQGADHFWNGIRKMATRTRSWRLWLLSGLILLCFGVGCRGRQHAHVLKDSDPDMVGSHTAGAETWKPLIDESVGRLLGKSCATIEQASHVSMNEHGTAVRSVCFVGVENRSGEVLGDFKEQIYDHISTMIGQHDQFRMISRRAVEAAMAELRCTPESLVLPSKQREFQVVLEREQQPFDYLLFARITSGTTTSNGDYQRDYLLKLELLNIHTLESIEDSAMLRKGYHKSFLGKRKHYDD